jgi:hypothetical protein
MKKIFVTILIASLFMFSCENSEPKKSGDGNQERLNSSEIISESYDFYGVKTLKQKDVSFKFRIHDYSFLRKEDGLIRTRKTVDTNNFEIKDVWQNAKVERFVNDSLVVIEDEKEKAYRNSINSVFYFAFLPNGLKDPAVNTELLDEVKIKGNDYFKIRVTFDEEGGGEDHNDIFIYWFDKEDYSMDYLAYEYFTEGGGIRFREAINVRRIEGITFQDYINHKPNSENMKLENTDQAYENGKLKEVSRIELENLKVE